MARLFIVLAVVFLMAIPGVVFAHDGVVGDVAGAGEAAGSGAVDDDWYGMLEAQGGTTWDFGTRTSRLYVGGKIGGYKAFTGILGTEIDIDDETEAKGPVTGLLGATYNVGNLRKYGVDLSWAEHIGFNVGLCATYEFETGDFGWRGMVSVLDLSLSDGNAKRQKNR